MSTEHEELVDVQSGNEILRDIDIPKIARATRADFRQIFLGDVPLLDVRAPVEHKKGAFPSAVNFPLMTDEERHQVGIRYKEAGQDHAIALGAELVDVELREARIKQWLAFFQTHPDGALYCFRGGLRSRIAQHWLASAGVDVPLIEGGYKAMRSFLINTLNDLCQSLSFLLIGGRTGIGKTLLLNKLHHSVDLEALACHRGSSFGGVLVEQPSNIDFEHALTIALMKLQTQGVGRVFLEDEARLIGRVCMPDTFINRLQSSPIVILECSEEDRIQNCVEDYVSDLLSRYRHDHDDQSAFSAFREHHRRSLAKIQKRLGGDNYHKASELLEIALHRHESHQDITGYGPFIGLLLHDYYDPMYDYQLSKKQHRICFKGTADEILEWATSGE